MFKRILLTIDIAQIYPVVIDKQHTSDAASCQRDRNVRAKPAKSAHRYRSVCYLLIYVRTVSFEHDIFYIFSAYFHLSASHKADYLNSIAVI